MVARVLVFLLTLLLLAGCGGGPLVRKEVNFSVPPQKETLFVVPFTTIMVPPQIEEGVFDLFVDTLNAGGELLQYNFVILKEGVASVDSQWLAEHNYVTGEIFGYVEEGGCCSTEIRLKSRLQLHQPGAAEPTLTLAYPRETFFEHDYSTVVAERQKLAADVARTLATRLLDALAGR